MSVMTTEVPIQQGPKSIRHTVEQTRIWQDHQRKKKWWRGGAVGGTVLGMIVSIIMVITTGLSWLTISALGATLGMLIGAILGFRTVSRVQHQINEWKRDMHTAMHDSLMTHYAISRADLVNGLDMYAGDIEVVQFEVYPERVKTLLQKRDPESTYVLFRYSPHHDMMIPLEDHAHKIDLRKDSPLYQLDQSVNQGGVKSVHVTKRLNREEEQAQGGATALDRARNAGAEQSAETLSTCYKRWMLGYASSPVAAAFALFAGAGAVAFLLSHFTVPTDDTRFTWGIVLAVLTVVLIGVSIWGVIAGKKNETMLKNSLIAKMVRQYEVDYTALSVSTVQLNDQSMVHHVDFNLQIPGRHNTLLLDVQYDYLNDRMILEDRDRRYLEERKPEQQRT